MLKNKMWHSERWEGGVKGRKKKSTDTLCLLIKELIHFFSADLKVPKLVRNFRKCQEVMQSVTMELKKKNPKRIKHMRSYANN
jgi:hypothetical protein